MRFWKGGWGKERGRGARMVGSSEVTWVMIMWVRVKVRLVGVSVRGVGDCVLQLSLGGGQLRAGVDLRLFLLLRLLHWLSQELRGRDK